jgi:hypothetical protein
LELPFAGACSEDGAAFRAYGLARGGLWALFGPAVLRRGLAAFRKGFRSGKPVGDVLMLPGTFVVDAAGRIEVAAYAAHAGDHLDAAGLRAALDRADLARDSR